MTVQHKPNTEELVSIAEMVWSSYLDPDGVRPLVVDPAPGWGLGPTDVVATVAISGAWDGRVLLSFSPPAARRAAAALLAIAEVDDVGEGDVADAVGELANIIGGSVKSLMPQPTVLSLPAVRTGPPGELAGTEMLLLTGTWMNEPVSIAVLESADAYVGTGGTAR